tara:strand:+ start:2464 stop:2886 length:423 start_codon:yes stop_codon:yes gene_type:complete
MSIDLSKKSSKYLNDLPNEKYSINDYLSSTLVASAKIEVVPIQVQYHLSASMAQIISSQVGIIFINDENNINKDREIILQSFELKCRKPITKTSTDFKLTLKAKRVTSKSTFYNFEFEFGNKNFCGKMTLILPCNKKFIL